MGILRIISVNSSVPLPDAPTFGQTATGWQELLPARTGDPPGVCADAGRLGGRWVAAASIAGMVHRHRGASRQDAYAAVWDGDVLGLAVADGLGSASHGGVGAAVASLEAASQLARGAHLHDAIGAADQAVRAAADGARSEPLQYATTLVAASVQAGDDDLMEVHAASVGDSSALVLGGGHFARLFADDDEGPVNVTPGALPSGSPTPATIVSLTLLPGATLVLCTDGLDLDLRLSPALRHWIGERLEAPASVLELLWTLSYRRRGSFDDRTALVVWP